MDTPDAPLTDADVARLVERDFAQSDRDEARRLLARYGAESWEPEVVRLRVALLRTAAGDLSRLSTALEVAKVDFRDALVAAEYTEAFCRENQLPPVTAEELTALRAQDRRQYRAWLRRP